LAAEINSFSVPDADWHNRGHTSRRDYGNWAKDNITEGVLRLGCHIAEEQLEKREKRRKKLSKDVGYSAKKRKDRRKR